MKRSLISVSSSRVSKFNFLIEQKLEHLRTEKGLTDTFGCGMPAYDRPLLFARYRNQILIHLGWPNRRFHTVGRSSAEFPFRWHYTICTTYSKSAGTVRLLLRAALSCLPVRAELGSCEKAVQFGLELDHRP